MPFRFYFKKIASRRLLALLGLVVGCSQSHLRSNTIELTLAHPASAADSPVYQRALNEFALNRPDVRVRRIAIAGDYYSKLLVMIAGNTAPDVMWMGQGFGEFARRGAFLAIDPTTAQEYGMDDCYASVLDWYRSNDQLCGFPYGIDCYMIYYNKDLFRQAGVPWPTDDWDLPAFLTTAQQLMNSDAARHLPGFYAFGGIAGIDRGAFGARLLNAEQTECWLDRPEAIEALQFNCDLKNRFHVSPSLTQGTEGALDSTEGFKLGRLAMLMGATWDLPTFVNQIKSFAWDVVLPPKGRQRSTWASSRGFAVYARTPHPHEATGLLGYLVSPDYQFTLCRETGCIPAHIPTARRWAAAWNATPGNVEAFLNAVPILNPEPRVPALHEILNRVQRANERALLGLTSAEQAMRDAREQVDAILARERRRQMVRRDQRHAPPTDHGGVN